MMVFGLFRRNAKPETLNANAPVAATSLVPVVPDERRLAQLGPILWQDVRYGMTRGEVVGVRSDAVRSLQDHKLHDAATAQLVIPHLRLGGHDYAVLFYFKEGRLTQVTVKTNGGPELSDFHDLVGALRLRYGQEVQIKVSHDSFSSAEWLSADDTNISLICHPEIGCLNVNFSIATQMLQDNFDNECPCEAMAASSQSGKDPPSVIRHEKAILSFKRPFRTSKNKPAPIDANADSRSPN